MAVVQSQLKGAVQELYQGFFSRTSRILPETLRDMTILNSRYDHFELFEGWWKCLAESWEYFMGLDAYFQLPGLYFHWLEFQNTLPDFKIRSGPVKYSSRLSQSLFWYEKWRWWNCVLERTELWRPLYIGRHNVRSLRMAKIIIKHKLTYNKMYNKNMLKHNKQILAHQYHNIGRVALVGVPLYRGPPM